MTDLLDEIVDRLPPSTVNLLLQISPDSQYCSSNFTNSLNEIQLLKINQITEDLKIRTDKIKSITLESRNYLSKVKSDLETMKLCKHSDDVHQSMKAYLTKIKELEMQSKNLTRHVGELNLHELFVNVETLNKEILDYKKKIGEAETKYKCYNGFPPNVEQAKKVITKIKEDIRQSESVVEEKLK